VDWRACGSGWEVRIVAPDPLNDLLGELLLAHDSLRLAEQPAAGVAVPRRVFVPIRRRRRRHGRRFGALAAAALALTASAAAAVVAVLGSAPLSGRLPQLLGTRYSLQVSPELRAGRAGWCVGVLDLRSHQSMLPVGSQCVSGSGPLIAGGGLAVISPNTGKSLAWLLYAIVNRQVATLRAPDGTRIRPIASPRLPSDWRAAITIDAHPRRLGRAAVITLTPLDAAGRSLPMTGSASLALPTRAVAGARPPAGGCRIDARPAPGLRILGARAVRGPLPRSLPAASGYLACYTLALELGGQASTAALLIGPGFPVLAPPAIPGLRRLPGRSGVWVGSASAAPGPGPGPLQRLFARRVPHGWLVLQSPVRSAAAVSLIEHLTGSA
jgi:hypothetical protein